MFFKGYVLENGGSENGVKEIENIFKYVMPKSIYVPKKIMNLQTIPSKTFVKKYMN